ncbi:MAG: serine/threonine-protein kinase [Planctomycetota bacterium]
MQRAVGRGGFGEVYFALADSGKQVALKYLRDNPEVELRGIAHVMNLKSPHLITIYDVRDNPQGDPFVIMEYVGGPSLRDLLVAEPGGLGPQKAAFFVDGVAQGLAYLHDRGIVHRDLKPANIFYDDGYVKIGDYGLSKHISVSKHSGQTVSVGTVHYMAPEIGSGSYTKAIDIYALGVILYELLTGRLPFTGASMGEILMRHLSDSPDITGIPEPFAGVIAKALAKDPKQRYADASEMVAALRQNADFSASVASFDPTSLSRIPRQIVPENVERTVTTPPIPVPPPPPLDVRAPLSIPGVADRLSEKLQKKAEKLSRKFEKKVSRLGGQWTHQPRYTAPAPTTGAPPGGRPHGRKGQIFVLLAVMVAVSIGLGVLFGGRFSGELATALGFGLAAGTFGSLLTYLKFLQRTPARSPMWDRLAYVGVSALLMIPAFAMAAEVAKPATHVLLAMLAAMLFCDWTHLINTGRVGTIRGKLAFWPAIVGLIVAAVAGGGHYLFMSAAACGALALLTQAGAALWPTYAVGRGHRRAGRWHARGLVSDPSPVTEQGSPAYAAEASPQESAGIPEPPAGVYRASDSTWRSSAVPRSKFFRIFFGVLTTLAVIGSLTAFFVLVLDHHVADDSSGLLFATLAGVACMPFMLSKTLKRYKEPVWRGTLRPLFISCGLCLAAGMISILAFQSPRGDEFAGTLFGLIAGSVVTLVCLGIPGKKAASQSSQIPGEFAEQSAEQAETPIVIDAAAPSFVGRTVNAGVSFLGKLLLVLGLALAVGHDALQAKVDSMFDESDVYLKEPGVKDIVDSGIPGALLLGITTFGSLLLILARRREGGLHLLRGCLGCALILWAVVMVLVVCPEACYALFTNNDWSDVDWDQHAWPLISVAIPLMVAFVLMTWPRRRASETVVV